MGILKDLIIGGVALKALKRSDRPGVVPPSSCTLLGMEHVGLGRTWKITYIDNDNPNVKLNFKIRSPKNLKKNGIKKILIFVSGSDPMQ